MTSAHLYLYKLKTKIYKKGLLEKAFPFPKKIPYYSEFCVLKVNMCFFCWNRNYLCRTEKIGLLETVIGIQIRKVQILDKNRYSLYILKYLFV